jgi:hypothetical protein
MAPDRFLVSIATIFERHQLALNDAETYVAARILALVYHVERSA